MDPYLPINAVLHDIRRETHDTKTYFLRLTDKKAASEFNIDPGQFIMISLWNIGEAPFSVSMVPNGDGLFATTIRAVGNVTRSLDRFEVGSTVGVRGPYGRGWPLAQAKSKNLLIIAGGLGLPPLRPVIARIMENRSAYGMLEILYGARTPSDLIYRDEYDIWRDIPEAVMKVTVDHVPPGTEWNGKVGVVTKLFDEMRATPQETVVMICGPEIMMKFAIFDLIKKGFVPSQIYVSLERRMKCGIAQCGHCQIGPKYVCKDGPVFGLNEIQGLPDLLI
jgi:NAD(P)H-flavin reductase